MSDGFTKLFNSLITSSVWSEDDKTRIVWITMLALCDKDGLVQASLPGLANAARVSIPDVEVAIEKLSSPDKYSRTKEHDGRRIVLTDGGWYVVNYSAYRDRARADHRREKLNEYQRNYLARAKDKQEPPPPAAQEPAPEPKKQEPKGKAFMRPTEVEVAEYAMSIRFSRLANHPEEFVDFYESKGWMVGKNKMKDWKAAVRTWARSDTGQQGDENYARI